MLRCLILLSPFLLCVFMAIFVPFFSPYDANLVDLSQAKLAPNLSHFFGTDLLGRDVFTRSAQALRISIIVGFCSSFLALCLGLCFALLSRLFFHHFFLAFLDMLLAVPALLLAMFIQSIMGGNLMLLILVLALSHFAFIAKVFDNELETLQKSDFYISAIVLGSSKIRALINELLPACVNLALIIFILNIAHAISGEASLSFFNLGVALGEASLGTLLSDGAKALFVGAWWLVFFPACLLLMLIMPLFTLANSLQNKFGVSL